MKKYSLSILLLCIILLSYGQDTLSPEKAVEIALQNNYSIRISRNQTEIAANNVSRGNAGMLPELNLNASGSFSSSNTKQEFFDGRSNDREGVSSNGVAAGVAMSWTIFDGMRMFATYDKLKELNAQGELSAKITVEKNVEQVILAYYDVVRQVQMFIAIDSTLTLFEERAKIAEEKWKIGSGSKSDFLQAQVDLNEQKSFRIKQKSAISSRKFFLNRLIGRKPEIDFLVYTEIGIDTSLVLEETVNAAMNKNNSILYSSRNISIAEFSLKEIKAQRLPVINLNSAYNFSKTETEAGLLLLNQNLGLNTGITASWTIFNGFNTRRQIRNSEILLINSKLELDEVKLQVESELRIAYRNYITALEALTLEEQNSLLAKENSAIMLERYRLGNATSIDIKTAQQSYYNALSRLVQARYEVKSAEISLLRLKGELVK